MDEARRNQLDVLEDIDENTESLGGALGEIDTDLDTMNTTLNNSLTAEQATAAALGAPADVAAASDTGTFSLLSLFKRLLIKFPASLGTKTSSASLSVTLSSDGVMGSTTDAAAASDTSAASHISLFKRLLSKIPVIGQQLGSASMSVTPSKDQDPIFDNANGTKIAVGAAASTTILTPPAGCKYASVLVTNDGFFRCDATAAGDLAGSQKLLANMERIIPVQAGVNVTFYSTVACTAYVVPFKDRP